MTNKPMGEGGFRVWLGKNWPAIFAGSLLMLACLCCALSSFPIDDSLIYWLFVPLRTIGWLAAIIWFVTLLYLLAFAVLAFSSKGQLLLFGGVRAIALPLLLIASVTIYSAGLFSSYYAEPIPGIRLGDRSYHLILSRDFDFGVYTHYYFYECDRFSFVCDRVETLPPRWSDQDWRDPVEPTLLADPSANRIVVMWREIVIYEYHPQPALTP